jgi:aryl-alcohol dehydrogenase-like predicted oxidoreductase
MSEFYGPTDEAEALATIDRALRGRRADFVVATRFGLVRDRNNPQARGVSGRPDQVRAAWASRPSTSTTGEGLSTQSFVSMIR